MIELTEQQIQALEKATAPPPRLVNPRTRQTYVLIPLEDYQRLKAVEYDDSPVTREERERMAWEFAERSGWDDYGEYEVTRETP